jgi:hypothetical protein
VHAAAGHALDRLGMKDATYRSGWPPAAHQLERGEVVGGDERARIAEVDLVLPGATSWCAASTSKPMSSRQSTMTRRISSALVHGAEIEVAGEVVRAGGGAPSGAFSKRKNSASQPAIISKPSLRARAI